jgi:hypothetical protein
MVLIQGSRFLVGGFQIISLNVEGGFSKRAAGDLKIQGPLSDILTWGEGAHWGLEASKEGLKVPSADVVDMTLFPDCTVELISIVDK